MGNEEGKTLGGSGLGRRQTREKTGEKSGLRVNGEKRSMRKEGARDYA